jgi:hypothetical protein
MFSFERASLFQGKTRNIRLVTMAEGNHAFPSRTRPLSPPAVLQFEADTSYQNAMLVLGPQGPGRVGRCQAGAQALETQKSAVV